MNFENEKIESVELNESELEQASGGTNNPINVASQRLTPGQIYRDSYSGRTFYVVKSGDTLIAIGRRYGLNLDQLKALNPTIYNVDRIYVYDVIWLN